MEFYLTSQLSRFLLSFFVFTLVAGTAFAQVIPWERPQMDTSHAALKEELRQQKIELHKFKDETERQQNEIQDLLATANYAVDVVGLMIAVAGITFGVYLNRLSKQAETAATKTAEVGQAALSASKSATTAREEAEKAAKRSEEVRDWINSDIRIIYEKMQREEVEYILSSLDNDPDQIDYLEERLMVAKLLDDDFGILERIFRKHISQLGIGEFDDRYRAYLKLLFVHFAGRLVLEGGFKGAHDILPNLSRSFTLSQLKKAGASLAATMNTRLLSECSREIGVVDQLLLALSERRRNALMLSIVFSLNSDDRIIKFLSQISFESDGKPIREYYGPLKEILDEVGYNLVDEDLNFNLSDLIEFVM